MDIREIHNMAGNVKGSVLRFLTSLIHKPFISKAAGYVVRFGIGFMLPGAIILGGWSPFGLGFAAALGASEGAMFGIIGTMLGYFRVLQSANGLKYIAICILIYTAGFVFRGTSFMKRTWFMPLSAAVSTAAIGFVFVADAGFNTVDIAFFITEVILVTVCTYAYQMYFNSNLEIEEGRSVGNTIFNAISLIILVASLLIPLAQIELIAEATLGRALAVFFIMMCGYYGGIGAGSCAGVVLGLAIGVAEASPVYCAMYGFSAVAASVFCKKGKLLYTVAYLISNAGAVFWVTAGEQISALYEAFFASVFFLFIGELFSQFVPRLESAGDTRRENSRRVRDFTGDRLLRASRAFGELGDMLSCAMGSAKENESNITTVFNHPAQKVCKKCELSSSCWEKEYVSTKDALNSVTAAMRERGRLEVTDLPMHFTSRCIHLNEFLNEVNRELIAFQYRRQFKRRIAESRKVICKQYRGMAEIFDRMSRDVAKQPKFDIRAEDAIRRILAEERLQANICVYRDAANHVHLQIEGKNLARLFENVKEYLERFSNVLGIALTAPEKIESEQGFKFLARQAEPLNASLGVAVHKKKDSELSGDSGSYFKLEDGRLCVILSDGMGSGKEAAAESADAIRMLERFLKSGIDPAIALATINSALVIKNAELGGFATLDFMCVDLFNGECEFYKFGSAPTYIKRGRHIRRIVSSSLPAGVAGCTEGKIEKTKVRLHNGDVVLLASDGVADAADDTWLQTFLSDFSGESAKELAAQLMNSAFSRYGRSDDMTIMTVFIGKN